MIIVVEFIHKKWISKENNVKIVYKEGNIVQYFLAKYLVFRFSIIIHYEQSE